MLGGRRGSHPLILSASSALTQAAGDMAKPGAGSWREAPWVDAGQKDARLFRYRVEEGRRLGWAAAIKRPGDADLTHASCQCDVSEPSFFVEIAVG